LEERPVIDFENMNELDQEIFDLAQIFTSRLGNKSPQKLD
jgi:hypothetical protein